MQWTLKANELGEITQTTWPLRHSRSFKVTNFSTNRKPICGFLLVINPLRPNPGISRASALRKSVWRVIPRLGHKCKADARDIPRLGLKGLILTYRLSCTVSKLWPIIGQIFEIDMAVPHFNAPAGGDPLRISG